MGSPGRDLDNERNLLIHSLGCDRDKTKLVHTSECPKTWHGESLAGSLKVRWGNDQTSWYDSCCAGQWVYDPTMTYVY